MQKIACIFSYKMSNWVSCQKIVFNLHKAYALNPEFKLINYNYSLDQTPGDLHRLAHQIFADRPEVIVILDHKPHPVHLLQVLLPLYEGVSHKPRLLFHVYGDFTLNYPNWGKLNSFLQGFEVQFVVASERQKILFDKFLPSPQSSLICPFPVDAQEFSFNADDRVKQRKEWGVASDETVFVFSGRLSRQKRTKTLINSFATLLKEKNIPARLYLYGHTDDIGDPFLNKFMTEGEYFHQINLPYKALPQGIQKRIHFMGTVDNSELKAVYSGADVLVNLSVHNDEDFGMSVAEAQSTGLPVILTDWGGLAGFVQTDYPAATKVVGVKIGKRNKIMNKQDIAEGLQYMAREAQTIDRHKVARLSQDNFGLKRTAEILQNILSTHTTEFKGFSSFFDRVNTENLLTATPYVNLDNTINSLYRELYESYLRPH